MSKFYIYQDEESAAAKIACRLTTDDDPQVQLVPGEWVKVSTCDPGLHELRVGVIVNQGFADVVLSLHGGTHNGDYAIEDRFYAPTDGNVYNIEVTDEDGG